MKKIITLGLLALFVFSAQAQSHLFISGSLGRSDGMPRQIADIGSTVGKHSRISVYAESFKTLPFYDVIQKRNNTGDYRKFFAGIRYAYVIPVDHILDIVPSLGLDIRLNGGNTQASAEYGTLGEVSNMPSLRPAIAIERPLSYNTKSVFSHIKLNVNRYYQVNFHKNTTRYVRPGVSAGIILIF